MPENKTLGLYIHIPFCKSRCAYCSFVSCAGAEEDFMRGYVARLKSEMRARREGGEGAGLKVNSVFFGGGTPTALYSGGVTEILKAAREIFDFSSGCEITAEANPESFCGRAEELYGAGVNRISLGLQSFKAEELTRLRRAHSLSDFYAALNTAVKAGFKNIGCDLIIGTENQDISSLITGVRELGQAGEIKHFSLYALSVEEGTPLHDSGYLPDPDLTAEIYDAAYSELTSSGYGRYEVSNFCKTGFECRHNLKYWNREEYLGVGAAAHSLTFNGGIRSENTADIDAYIAGEPPARTTLAPEEKKAERLMLALRLENGLDLAAYEREFSESVTDGDAERKEKIAEFIKSGALLMENGRLKIAPRFMFVQNSIISALI